MKLIIILTVALLGLTQVNGECFDLVHQYYQCKHLKMVNKYAEYGFAFKYKPDSSVPNNALTDKFYQKLTSNEMNFDKAMNLFRKIYTETNNCSSEFCRCVSQQIVDENGKYSMYFRNETIFPHAKKIIEAFIKKFESKLRNLKNASEFQYYFNENWKEDIFINTRDPNLKSLAQFCVNHDYTKNRLIYYHNNFSCSSALPINVTVIFFS